MARGWEAKKKKVERESDSKKVKLERRQRRKREILLESREHR